MRDFTELECNRCHTQTGVFYHNDGDTFYQIFFCEKCKDTVIEEELEANTGNDK